MRDWRDFDPLDYGEGKTREQEAEDSAFLLGVAILLIVVFFVALAVVLVVTGRWVPLP